MPNTHRQRRRDSTVDGFGRRRIENWPCSEFIQPSLAAELETGSITTADGWVAHRPTQLNSTQHVQFSIFLPHPSAVVVN